MEGKRSRRIEAIKRKKRRRRIALAILMFCLIVAIVFMVHKVTETKVDIRETRDRVEINESSNWKKYNIKINYPKTEYSKLNKKIEKYTEGVKEDFLTNIKGFDAPEDDSFFDLNVSYTLSKYKKVCFVHMISYQYTGGANYAREDKTFIYDTTKKKYMDICDLLESKKMLEDFAGIAREYVEEYFESNDMAPNAELIKDGTEPVKENFENIYIRKDGMHVVFPPYQVGTRADGEIAITIPFEELVGVVKEKYLDETIVKEVKAMKARERDLSVFEGKPVVALTFDDGPNDATTRKLVDTIDKYGGRATFFVLGSRVSSNAEALKYAYEKGNQIGSHTYSHLDLTKMDKASLKNEINKTDNEIKKITGTTTTVMRPPYGSVNDKVEKASGKATILWSVDTQDWASRDKNAVAKEIVKHAKDGDIILMHDIYDTSVDGCAIAMKKLYKKGFRFVTVDEMAKLKGKELSSAETYYSFR